MNPETRQELLDRAKGIWSFRLGPFYAMGQGVTFWFRLFGKWGAGWTDHRVNPPLFSERYGYRKPRPLHVGPYCFFLLTPRRGVAG